MAPRKQTTTLSDLPWWVQAVAFVGAPTAIACFLVWWLTGSITTRLDAIENNARQHMATEAIAIEQQWQVVGTLLRVCLNTSQTAEDRLACVAVPRRTP